MVSNQTSGQSITEDAGFLSYQRFVKQIDRTLGNNKKHKENVVRILKYLALHGLSTTWTIGQNSLTKKGNPADGTTRRILNGRTDRLIKSPGLVQLKAVSSLKKEDRVESSMHYQLTLYGILYTIKNCNFTDSELYTMAQNYKEMIPYLFDKTEYLEKNGISLKPLKLLCEGNILKLEKSMNVDIPYQEIFNFLSMHYPVKTFSFTKSYFVSFIAYWFYTYLMWDMYIEKHQSIKKWRKIVSNDPDIHRFYSDLINKVLLFYKERNERMESVLSRNTRLLFSNKR